jgi:protein phosphatase
MTDVMPPQALQLRAAGMTDAGQRRQHNEDQFAVHDDLLLFVVADGAGGHNAGEVASALAVRSITNYFGATVRSTWDKGEFDQFGLPTGARRLSAAIHKANADVMEISRTVQKHRGMGTTVVAATFSPRSGLLHVAHVGDSRCYRLRGGHLELLTQDHSLLTDVLEARPDLDDAVLARLPKNIVTRALGVEDELRVSIRSHAVVMGDRYVLCSDGLSGPVPASEMVTILAAHEHAAAAAQALVVRANELGGPDNVSAIVIDCDGGYETALPASASYPPPPEDSLEFSSDPELLIIGIEEIDLGGTTHTASDDLLQAVNDLMTGKRDP